jgi:endonuclease YncB( thermonuclease family)
MLRLQDILVALRRYPLTGDGVPTERQIQAIELLGLGRAPDDMTFAEASAVLTARSAAREVLGSLGGHARITRAVRLQLEPYIAYLILNDRQVLFELIGRNQRRWGFCKSGFPPPTRRTRDTVFNEAQRLIEGVPFAFHSTLHASRRTQYPARTTTTIRSGAGVLATGTTGSFNAFIRSLLSGGAKRWSELDGDNGYESDVAILPLETMRGIASVVDGDTIDLHGQRIRIWGIDAPEAGQLGIRNGRQWRCGHDCSQALADFLDSRIVECVPRDVDEFDRVVAQCTVGRQDVGAWMVRNGWALDYKQFSDGRYAREQREAFNAKRGLWQGEFELPWKWRVRSRWLADNCQPPKPLVPRHI